MRVGQTDIAASVAVGQLGVVEAQPVQHRGVQVVQVGFDFDVVVVGLTETDAGIHATTTKPSSLTRLANS